MADTNVPGLTPSVPREVTSIFPEVANLKQEAQIQQMKGAGASQSKDSPMVNADDWKGFKGSSGDGGNKGAVGGGPAPDQTFSGQGNVSQGYDIG